MIEYATERGNVSLSSDDGAQLLWIIDGERASLEIAFTPDNYPAWHVASCDISLVALAKHINENLQGWCVRKANLDGLNLDGNGERITFKEENDERDI